MCFRVIYTSALQNHAIVHTTEWICPSGYTADRARQSFQERYPSAAIVQLRPWQL
jgi:hypothetical protein